MSKEIAEKYSDLLRGRLIVIPTNESDHQVVFDTFTEAITEATEELRKENEQLRSRMNEMVKELENKFGWVKGIKEFSDKWKA